MGRARRSLVHKMLRAADSEFFELPRGWHVFSRYRTAELFLKHPAPPAVQFADQDLYRKLFAAYPEVKLEPLRINSARPSLARRFVGQQQELIKQHVWQQKLQQQRQQQQQQQQQLAEQPQQPGQDQQQQQVAKAQLQEAAFRETEERMRAQLQAAGREVAAGGYLEFIQQQEEEALAAALRRLEEQQSAAERQ